MIKSDLIKVVFFDMGGTLEHLNYDDKMRLNATNRLLKLLKQYGLDPNLSTEKFYQLLISAQKKYKNWSIKSKVEIKAADFWNKYVFVDKGISSKKVARIAELLTFFVDTNFYDRQMREEVPQLLKKIKKLGFKIGCISNTLSTMQVPYCLQKYGIIDYFEIIVLSCIYGRRKPDPQIFEYATKLLKASPTQCVYVGDTISRDIIGAKKAKFGLSFLIPSFLTSQVDLDNEEIKPDATIHNLEEIIEIIS